MYKGEINILNCSKNFQKLAAAQDDSKMSLLARQAFDETLAAHQPLAMRTAARLACKTLPIRKEFVDKLVLFLSFF